MDARVAGIVAVANGVDDGFPDGIKGKFGTGGHFGGQAFRTGSRPVVDATHHETRGLVDELKDIAPENLVSRDGLFNDISIKLYTFHFRCDEEFLRLFPEKQDGGIGNAAVVVNQVEVLEEHFGLRVFGQGEIAFPPRHVDKIVHLGFVEVVDGGTVVEIGIERLPANQFLFLQIPYQ